VSWAAATAIVGIDELILVFEKLLRIAEAESGACRQTFEAVPLAPIIADVAELYDAMAEEQGMTLLTDVEGAPLVLGDKNLLAGAMANLVDNALKYAGAAATIRLRVVERRNEVILSVQDNGPGIPAAERSKVVERFYRLDAGRSQPGNGLGLPMVTAVATLHGGRLLLDDGAPGIIASIVLPRMESQPFQTVG
jgi:signal transduction histidine kinase